MDVALDKRNFLIHRFFLERRDDLKTEAGRMELLEELVGIDLELETATRVTRAICRPVCRRAEGTDKDDTPASRDCEKYFSFDVDLPD